MNTEDKYKRLKDALIAIIIGACVAFLSSLFEGLTNLLQGGGSDMLGGGAASITYLLKQLKNIA